MIQLNELQKYQLNFCLQNNTVYNLSGQTVDWDDFHKFEKSHDKFVILYYTEIFSSSGKLQQLQDRISIILQNEPHKEIYISQATSTKIKYGLDPLINLIYWKGVLSRKKINIDDENILLFEKGLFKDTSKKVKGIFSIRKRNPVREYIFNKIKEFDGIIRYSKWPQDSHRELIEGTLKNVNVDDFPTWYDIINEYKSSYFSFIIESHSNSNLNQLSEKTILAFMTKTIPIVLGGRGYVKELEDMGFWVGNSILGVDFDNSPTESYIRFDSFVNAIENYNKLDLNDVTKIYNHNMNNIQNNFNIVSNLVEGNEQIFN